jgi:hypothetical protein
MTRAHTSDRTGEGAVYETEAAAVNVRPRRAEGGRSLLEYAVETDHPAPVRVRVRQPMPESAGIDDLGFPGECAEDWERDGDALLFERDVAPGATVRTAWGIDGELGEDLEPPTIEAEPVSIELDDEFEIDEGVLEGVDGDDSSPPRDTHEDQRSDDEFDWSQ